jgi:hypothetical protein
MSIESAPQRLKALGIRTQDELDGYCLPHNLNLALPYGKEVPLSTYELVKNAYDVNGDGLVDIGVIYDTILRDVFGPQFEYDKDVTEIYKPSRKDIRKVFEEVRRGHIVTVLLKAPDRGLHAETLTGISGFTEENDVDMIKGARIKQDSGELELWVESFPPEREQEFINFYRKHIAAFIIWPVVKTDETAEV